MLMIYLAVLENDDEREKMAILYEQNKFALLSIALKITHNQSMSEDAVHNAFLSMINHKDKMFSLSCRDFRRWSVVIVKGKCIDLLRKQNLLSEVPLEDFEYELESNEGSVEIQVINKMEYDKIRKYIAQLDEASKTILEMKYILNMSYKEIAKELDITEKNVDMRLYRAKQKVRKLLEQELIVNEI